MSGFRYVFRLAMLAAFFGGAEARCDEIPLTGAYPVTVASGTQTRLSDKITGSGRIVLLGGGTLILDNPENDFTGGIIVSNGIIQAEASGAFGSGPISLEGTAATRTVSLNVDKGVFPNSIMLKDKTTAKSYPALKVLRSATVSGELSIDQSLAATTDFFIATSDSGVRLELTGACNAGVARVGFTGNGKTVMRGVVTASRLTGGGSFNDNGSIDLYNSGNLIDSVYIYAFDIYCRNANVMYGTHVFFDWNAEWGANGHGFIFVGGTDQTFRGIHGRSLPAALARDGYSCALPLMTSADAHSVITIMGRENGDFSGYCYSALNGNFSIVVDKVASGMTLYQRFSYRTNRMKGDFTIRSGNAYFQNGATFPNVTNLVATGGSLQWQSVTNVMPALKTFNVSGGTVSFDNKCLAPLNSPDAELHLSSSAQFYVGTGVTNTVKRLYLDGVAMKAGIYNSDTLPPMKHATAAATWSGALVVRRGPKGLVLRFK